MRNFSSVGLRVDEQGIWILDQTLLPQKEEWLLCREPDDMVRMIRELKVRGAPLIGVAAALQLGQFVEQGANAEQFLPALHALRDARPTAVNLMNALDRLLEAFKKDGLKSVPSLAERICLEDVELAEKMCRNAASVIEREDHILTHCNTGGLATVGLGTALGGVIQAARDGKSPHVFVDETRPLLQGGRLTTWELAKNKIPYTLICDNMAAFLMQKNRVNRVMVGADRIAVNGDFANKVGTYSLAVLCKHHGVPFYVVAPQTTIDKNCADGAQIPIEERAPFEVRGVRGSFGAVEWSMSDAEVWNPAFDVTPHELVSGWILDTGVFNLKDVRAGALKQ